MTLSSLGAVGAALAAAVTVCCGPTGVGSTRRALTCMSGRAGAIRRGARCGSRPAALIGRARRLVVRLRAGGAGAVDARLTSTAELLSSLAAHLGAGLAPREAFVRCGDEVAAEGRSGEWASAVEMVRLGDSVPRALLAVTRHPVLRGLAVAWQVSESTGAPLGPVAASLGDAVRAELRHRRSVDAELAGVRASGRLLGALPVFGLLLGTFLGAGPVRFLLTTDGGRVCLVGGFLLMWAGLRWTGAIADGARRGR
jgi:tight adherence protein B